MGILMNVHVGAVFKVFFWVFGALVMCTKWIWVYWARDDVRTKVFLEKHRMAECVRIELNL